MVGDRIGPYEIATSLGAGGMGEVYRATDTCLGRAVAIKVLNAASGATAAEIERFQREPEPSPASVTQHLHAPRRQVLGERAFPRDGTGRGYDPGRTSRESPVPLDEALSAGAQIARALDAATAVASFTGTSSPGT